MLGNGNCQSNLNLISGARVHANGFSTTGLGTGAHMHYAASTAAFFWI